MHRLAIEFDARLEFVPVERETLDRADGVRARLRDGSLDIVIGGVAVTPARAEAMQLSGSYLDETLGFVVPDGERRQFESWDAIRARGALTIAVPDVPYYIDRLQALLPQARLRPVDHLRCHVPRAGARGRVRPAGRARIGLDAAVSAILRRGPRAQADHRAAGIRDAARGAGLRHVRRHVDRFEAAGRDHRRAVPLLDSRTRLDGPPGPRWSIIRDVLHWVAAGASPVPRRYHQPQLLDPEAQGVGMDPEPHRRVADAVDAPAALAQHALDMAPLDVVERVAAPRRSRGDAAARRADTERIVELKRVVRGADHRALDDVFELADIARPVVVLERRMTSGGTDVIRCASLC